MSERLPPEAEAAFVRSVIGMPWQRGACGPDSYDCWTMAAHVQATLFGRDLPLSPSLEIDTTDHRAVIEAIRTSPLQRQWLPVSRRGHGDLVLMRRHAGPSHCGVWLDLGPGKSGVLHCSRRVGTVFWTMPQLRAQYRDFEFRRPAIELLTEVSKADQSRVERAMNGREALAVIVRDPVQPLVGAEYVPIDAGGSPDAVLALLEPRLGGTPAQRWCILNDVPLLRCHPETGEDEWTLTAVRSGDVLWIVPEPPAGEDGSSIVAALATIVLAIAAPYLVAGLGFATLGTTAATLTVAGQVLAAGIAIGGSLLISALVQPSLPQGPEAVEGPSATYTLTPPGNRLRPGGQVPRPYGTVRRQPELLARPYGDFAGNEQSFYVLLCVGIGKHRINEIGIGDSAVWTSEGGLTGTLDDVEIEILQPGERVTLFPADVQSFAEVGGQVLAAPVAEVETEIGPYVAVEAASAAISIVCDFAFARGLFSLSDKGDLQPVSVTWRTELREIDDLGDPVGSWTVAGTHTVEMATTTPQRFTRAYAVSEGRYEARAIRSSASDITENRGQDELSWVGLKSLIPGDQTFDDVCAVAIKARATETTSAAQLTWYVDSTAILPRWDSATETWIEEATESIEAAARDVIEAGYGLGFAETQIDLDALQALAEVWEARSDVCCLVIDTAQGCWSVLEAVLGTGRTLPQMLGSTVTFTRDQPQAFPVQFLTHADITRGSLTVIRDHYTRQKPNVIVARYWDRSGAPRTIECVPAGVTTKRPATVDIAGIVDRDQVFREGVTMAASNYLRRTTLSFSMLDRGRSLLKGDLIAISHPRPVYGLPTRVAAVDWPQIALVDPHAIDDESPDQYLRLSMPDGGSWGPVKVTAGEHPNTVVVDETDFNAILAAADPVAVYSADPRGWIVPEDTLTACDPDAVQTTGGLQVQPTRASLGPDQATAFEGIVLGMRPRGDGLVEVLCVNDHAGVHTAETGTIPPAVPVSALSPVAGAPVWAGAQAETFMRSGVCWIAVGGPAVPGANRYVAEISVDEGESWARVDSASPSLEIQCPQAETVQVRWAAVGTMRGPWGSGTVDGVAPVYDLAAPTGFSVTEPPEPEFRFRWDISLEPTGWFGTLKDGTTELRTFAVTTPHYDYLEDLQVEDGGPFRTVTLEVSATRGEDSSPVTSFSATNPAPAAPTGIAYSVSLVGSSATVDASCDAGDTTVREYRFAVTNTDTSPPVSTIDSQTGTEPEATLIGMTQSSTYYLHVGQRDAVDSFVWAAPIEFTTPSA